jgi:TatA/E family protein of Tat protein translocase
MPFNIGPGELIIVLIIALIVVGPGKLPDVGAALGKSIKEFRNAATDVKESTSLDAPAAVTAGAAPAAAAAPAANVIAATAAPNTIATATPNTISTPPAPEAAAIAAEAVPEAPPEPAPEPVEPSDEQPAPTA